MTATDHKIRIQKWLSQQGITSRREAERMILEGAIKVNGRIIKELGYKIDPDLDKVSVAGKSISNKEPAKVYWLLNKPTGFLTSTRSQGGKPTIYDLPKLRKISLKVSPVGRLDYQTEGLLLLSNDGDFVFKLSHPSFKLARQYQALINRRLSDEELREIARGIELEDGPVKKIEIKYLQAETLGKTRGYWYLLTVYEGRNRLVRRIFASFDCRVIRLVRSAFGNVALDLDLKPGDYRQMTAKELSYFKAQLAAKKERS